MAMSTSSAFTTADRRKKVVTYGRSARLTAPRKLVEDAPSPERARKQPGSSSGTTQKVGGLPGTATTLGNPRSSALRPPASRDLYDVPSDDELAPRPSAAPLKKSFPRPEPEHVFEFPASDDERTKPRHRPLKAPQPLRKVEPAKAPSTKPQEVKRVQAPPAVDPLAPHLRRRAKTPQPPQQYEHRKQNHLQPATQTDAKAKVTPRARTPAPMAQKKTKATSTIPAGTATTKKAVDKTAEKDVYDVPSSDEDAPSRTPVRPRLAPLSRMQLPPNSRASVPRSPELLNDSDDSNTSKKRKRRASVSSSATAKGPVIERKREPSVPQRSRKYPRKEDSVSAGNVAKVPGPLHPAINKPKRTRMRTVPVPTAPTIAKGQSSPAKLHSMLAVRSVPKPPLIAEVPDITVAEDETMYDVQEEETSTAQVRRSAVAGSVTPRQKALFNHLLDESFDSTTPLPSISKLQLTDRRPGSLIAGLKRSSSDVPQTAHTRRTKLVDVLRQAVESSDEDSESDQGSDEESDEETEDDITVIPAVSLHTRAAINGTADQSDKMDVDSQMPSDSQTSQPSQTMVHLQMGARRTYAQQRSYLEESNFEDAVLSMDLDDELDPGTNKAHGFASEDEDDPSQVRGIHELRRQGQHHKFQAEAESSIDDIAGKSELNSSQRRGAMIDFATRMADKSFIDQLLESALTFRLLESIACTGEIVFDFAATVAVLFILETKPGYSILSQAHQSGIVTTLSKLLDSALDIHRIARDRTTNMARSAQETVAEFRALILRSSVWSSEKPEKVSPQLVALKTLELLVIGLRKAGNSEALFDEAVTMKLLDIASGPCQHLKEGKGTIQDRIVLDTAFSILEASSVSNNGQPTWTNEPLRRLVEMIPFCFDATATPIRLVIRLCMNLTNNKPKACQTFSGPNFVIPLVRFITHRFKVLIGELDETTRNEVMEDLILSLGAMINLAEFSDQARTSVIAEGDELIDELAKIFLEGSARADQADSVEESQSSVTIGYLTILLGNLCLNDRVRSKVRSRLPGQKIDMLAQKVKEFVAYNQRVDRITSQFEGEEGRETLRNFTIRLMLVVERLEKAGA